MSQVPPQYHLRRINSDGTAGPLEILPLDEFPNEANVSRRGFVGAGFAIGSLVTMLNANQGDAAQFKGNDGALLQAHQKTVHALTVAPDGKTLFSCSSDRTVKVWSFPDGVLQRTLVGHTGAVKASAVSPNGAMVATGSSDRSIKLWSLPDGAPLKTLKGHGGSINALAIVPDGSVLISGSSDHTINIWSLPDGALIGTLRSHQGPITALAIHPNGRGLVSASADKTVKLWDIPNRRLVDDLPGSDESVAALLASKIGSELITGSLESRIRLWSLAKRRKAHEQQAHAGGALALAALSASSFASGGADKDVLVWSRNAQKVAMLDSLQGHNASIQALAGSPDEQWLVSGDSDGVVIIWNLQRRAVHGFLFDAKVNHVKATRFQARDEVSGQLYTFTLPCGSPLPITATCLCNCVPGTIKLAVDPQVEERNELLSKREQSLRERRERARELQTERAKATQARRAQEKAMELQRRMAWQQAMRQAEMDRQNRLRYYPSGGSSRSGGSTCTCNTVCICIPVCQAHRLLHSDSVIRTMAEQLLLMMGRQQFAYMRWAADGTDQMVRNRIYQVMSAIERGAKTDISRWPGLRHCLARLNHSDRVVAIMAAQMAQNLQRCLGVGIDRRNRERIDYLLSDARRRPWHSRR